MFWLRRAAGDFVSDQTAADHQCKDTGELVNMNRNHLVTLYRCRPYPGQFVTSSSSEDVRIEPSGNTIVLWLGWCVYVIGINRPLV